MSHRQRQELRQGKAVKIMDQMKQWLDRELTLTLPKSPLGQAIRYTLNMWDRLKGYTAHGRLEIDNNLIENSIRPVALGRKNYLFAGSHQAAQRNAMMYSLFACCKRAQVEPFEWIRDVIQRIPDQKPSRMAELLPHKWMPALHENTK